MSRPYEKGAAASPLGWLARAGTWPFVGAIWFYRLTLSPIVGGSCRFEPTCSCYGLESYRLHGPVRGTWLTLRRVLRCHPLGGGGYDPVPQPARAGRNGLAGAPGSTHGGDAGGADRVPSPKRKGARP